jgi:hypothetical protein
MARPAAAARADLLRSLVVLGDKGVLIAPSCGTDG